MAMQTAVYMRVSTNQQSTRSQQPDIERWLAAQNPETLGDVKWYRDKATGKNMDRPGWQKLQAAIDVGNVQQLVVWRLDRIGRSAAGLCKLFEELTAKKVNLVSLKESVDLQSASGRLLAHILASVAAFETELRGERVRAGQQAARDSGKVWGGSAMGRLAGISVEQATAVADMAAQKMPKSKIAKSVGIDRSSVYRLLARLESGDLLLDQTA